VDVTDVGATDGAITRALGEELRRVRHQAGLSRAELVDQMSSDIHVRTLATYEQGARQCTVVRLVEICRTLGVAAPDVLWLALQRAELDLETTGLQVDLRAVIRDERVEFGPLRRWAHKRLERDPDGQGIARLNRAVVQEIAIFLDYSWQELVRYLLKFSPQTAPRDSSI